MSGNEKVAEILADPNLNARVVRFVVDFGSYLIAEDDWTMEDNFGTTETLHELAKTLMTRGEALRIRNGD